MVKVSPGEWFHDCLNDLQAEWLQIKNRETGRRAAIALLQSCDLESECEYCGYDEALIWMESMIDLWGDRND